MNCATALDRMLEAERGELEGGGGTDSELSRHLRGCATCRAAAARILDAERALGDALAAMTPRRRAEDAMAEAAQRAGRRRWAWRAVPLAAAATLAALLLARREPTVSPLPPLPPAPSAAVGVEVQGPLGRSVAVFQTNDRAVVVIWFF